MTAESVRAIGVVAQSNPVDVTVDPQATDVAHALALLRSCVHDCGWTMEALEASMKARTNGRGFDKSYICRVLNGERPLTLAFLVALPNDVEARFSAKYAEGFGQIVVAPARGEQAVRNFVSGLLGVLADRERA